MLTKLTCLSFIMMFLCGCMEQNKLSQAQLNAIETREVSASLDETFNAASGALFDAGYTISMSDRQGGLLTGTKAIDRSADRFWVSPYIEDTKFALSILIRETAPKNCTVRIKTSINGAPKIDKEAIDRMWVLMQRQVLMKEPLSLSNGNSRDMADTKISASKCTICGRAGNDNIRWIMKNGKPICIDCDDQQENYKKPAETSARIY